MKDLTDTELIREWMSFFGLTTGSRLLGWCVLTGVLMPAGVEPSERALIQHGWGAVSTRYRNVDHLKGFNASLEARGLRVADDDDERPAQLLRALSV